MQSLYHHRRRMTSDENVTACGPACYHQKVMLVRLTTFLGFLIVLAVIGGAVWVIYEGRCASRCNQALSEGGSLAGHGEVRKALRELDEVDGDCNCARFTQGDEPPELSAAREWFERYRQASGEAAAAELARNAAGPIVGGLE